MNRWNMTVIIYGPSGSVINLPLSINFLQEVQIVKIGITTEALLNPPGKTILDVPVMLLKISIS